MRVAIAADHAGYEMKERLAAHMAEAGHDVLDFGADGRQPVDYPDYAEAVGLAIEQDETERGVLICGSGIGVCVAANKMPGIRAGLCHDTYSARQGVEHDDMNVLVLGARIVGEALARDILFAFLGARFSGAERHRRRLEKLEALESRYIDVE
jgi:ribose 5-phosphate isomerase B